MSISTVVHEEEATLKVVTSQINEGQIGATPLHEATLLRVVDLFLIWRAYNSFNSNLGETLVDFFDTNYM